MDPGDGRAVTDDAKSETAGDIAECLFPAQRLRKISDGAEAVAAFIQERRHAP